MRGSLGERLHQIRSRRASGLSRVRLAAARLAITLPFDRLRQHLLLIAFLAAGHLLALTLILAVPLYADGVNSRLLQETLRPDNEPARADRPALRPRTSLFFQHYASIHGPVDMAGFQAADAYLKRDLNAVTGLPATAVEAYVYSDKLRLMPAELATDLGVDPIAWISLGFDDTVFDRIDMVEGRLPELASPNQPMEVILHQGFVNEHGLRPGDVLVIRGGRTMEQVAFDAIVTGVWRERPATDGQWPVPSSTYREVLLVPRETYDQLVAPEMGANAWYSLVWYTQFPREAITVANTPRVRAAFAELQFRSARLLGGRMELESPDAYLADFQSRAIGLRTLLWVFSIPTLAIVLLYVVSTSSLFAQRQRAEIAVLKGRGASQSQLIGAYLVEGALVDLLPLLLAPLVAFGAAQLIGRAEAFLQFGSANALPLRLTPDAIRLALIVLAVTLVLGMLPVMAAARQTLISYQQQVAREARRPIWQRLYLDLFVLLAAGYGYYTLRRQGSLIPLGGGTDPFSNPLSLLLPALALLGSSLVVVRFFPALAALLAWLGRHVWGATTLLALRHLARSPQQGTSIVLLTVLTLALGSFSASMATTLDRNDHDRILYANGAQLRISENAELSRREEQWTMLPAWEHGEIPGVQSWARVRREDVQVTIGGGTAAGGALIALDRGGFHEAGWWRPDLSDASLGRLMNSLAAEPHALIVSRPFLGATRLNLGDTVTLTINTVVGASTLDFVIRGAVDNFPMLYPKPDQFFFVANYDYVALASDPVSHDVLLELDPGTPVEPVVEAIKEHGFDVDKVNDASALIAATRARPERVGFVGLLSLGFMAATILTMLALLLYSLFSFRRRMVEIGVLRAAGLSIGQLIWLLAFELCFLTLTSAVAGILLGIGAARLFVPFYQLGTTLESRTPDFIVVIAWGEIGRLLAILCAMLVLTLVATTVLLRRLRIHEAIKLGQELG